MSDGAVGSRVFAVWVLGRLVIVVVLAVELRSPAFLPHAKCIEAVGTLVAESGHLGEEEGDDDEPDDVAAEGREALREGQRLGGDHRRRHQKRPRARRQRLQHQPCS